MMSIFEYEAHLWIKAVEKENGGRPYNEIIEEQTKYKEESKKTGASGPSRGLRRML
jgi:hypothetical protein